MVKQITCALSLFLAAMCANAEPVFARYYKAEYGYQPSCNACHKDGGGSPLNSYGKQFEQQRMTRASFAKIAKFDADGDGFTNGTEITAKANPGDSESTPDQQGDWLAINNLIPKQIQALFPEVSQYKPIDAILTEKEITRAAKLNVSLTPTDENTIYVPIQNRKPLGTAIIVPAVYNKQQFFLLVVTDRQLNITHIQPLNIDTVPAAAELAAYQSLLGNNATSTPQAEQGGIEQIAHQAIKKAITLIHVRLKKG